MLSLAAGNRTNMVLDCPFPHPKLLRTENTGGMDAFLLRSARAFPPGKGEKGGEALYRCVFGISGRLPPA